MGPSHAVERVMLLNRPEKEAHLSSLRIVLDFL